MKTFVEKQQKQNNHSRPDYGVCPECISDLKKKNAVDMRKYLDDFPFPILLLDSERKVLIANTKAKNTLKPEIKEIEGYLVGDAIGCKYYNLPGGCGYTVHCKTCTIRNTINDTFASGNANNNVKAFPDLHFITGNMKLEYSISTQKINDCVLLTIEKIPNE